MAIFKIDNKIIWRKDSKVNIAENFYPSAYKELMQKETFLKENFKVEIVDADKEKLHKLFLPLYFQEVASKKDFTLSRETIAHDITKKLKSAGSYKFMFIYFQSQLIFAWLFCFKKDGLYMAYRAFNRNFDKTISRKAPISYWAEKMLFTYGKENGALFFSHGRDSHPYVGKSRIGLPLYKIKTGVKPRNPGLNDKALVEKIFEGEDLRKNSPVLFFSNIDKDGFYKSCYLYFPEKSLDKSYLKEFKKVMAWAGINFIPVAF